MNRRMALALLAGSLRAQEPAAPETRIRSTVRLVVTPVAVVDAKGEPVGDYRREALTVREGGVVRPCQIEEYPGPISLVVALESSPGVARAMLKVQQSASLFLPLVAGDRGEVALLAYADEVKLVQPFTRSERELADALRRLRQFGSGGVQLDAVARGLDLLAETPPGRRRVMLVVGEAKDKGSSQRYEDLLPRLERERVTVYFLTHSPYRMAFTGAPVYDKKTGERVHLEPASPIEALRRLGQQDTARLLADQTGGLRSSFLRQRALEDTITAIGQDIHGQVLLTFPPAAATAGFHPFTVTLEGRPELTVRARSGYWIDPPDAP